MATINGLYIFVANEDANFGVDVSEHTVETGVSISDHVKRHAMTISLTGEIVGKNAASIRTQLRTMHQTAVVCNYSGRCILSNCIITEFSTSHPNTIWGGCEFSMTLKEIRTASTSYKATAKTQDTKNTGTQQPEKKSKEEYVYHTVKKGDTVWALVAASKAPYKSLSRPKINSKSYSACDWVMQMNQSAFSRKGDFGTLQIGKKLIVGVRNGSGSISPNITTSSSYKLTIKSNTTNNAYVGSITVTYVKAKKSVTTTYSKAGSYVFNCDSDSRVIVKIRAKDGHTFSTAKVGSWEAKSTTHFVLSKITKNSAVTVTWKR